MNKLKKEIKGFTIIEVVIVLAIAALIIVIVLLAVGALQRSQRDTARKQVAGRVISGMQTFTANNNNTPPTAASLPNIASGTLAGNTTGYNVCYVGSGGCTGPDTNHQNTISYGSNLVCNNTNDNFQLSATNTNFAVLYWSESKGGNVCVTNNS